MKGLIYKDFLALWKSSKSFLLAVMIFVAVGMVDSNLSYFWIFPCIFAGNMAVTLLSLDERDKWTEYCCALPITRKQYVTAKYLISALVLLVILAFMALALSLRMLALDAWDPAEMGMLLSVLLTAGLLIPGIMLPMMFKFGVEKGRMAYLITIGGASGVVAALSGMDVQMSGFTVLPAVLALGAVALYIGSWLLAVELYQNKEL